MDKESRHDDDDEQDEFELPEVPIAADGGPVFGYGVAQPAPVPERNPENFVCLRGPCRHYWYLQTMAQEGNPAGTWEHLGIKAPRQHSHTCLVNPGHETSFAEDNVFECNKWDPMTKQELVQLTQRRQEYFEGKKNEDV